MDPSSSFLPASAGLLASGRAMQALAQGRALLRACRPDEAEPFLREALATAPADEDVLLAMAEMHHRRGTEL
jgi:hypothetical protein